MIRKEQLIKSHKTISKVNAVLFSFITILSIYLLQRAFLIFEYIPEHVSYWLREMDGRGIQVNFWMLGLTYKTLSYIWPMIVFALCFPLSVLLDKQVSIFAELKKQNNDFDIREMEILDPLFIISHILSSKISNVLLRFLSIFPLLAILFHFISIVSAFIIAIIDIPSQFFLDRWLPGLIQTSGVLIATGLGICGALRFFFSISSALAFYERYIVKKK